MSPDAGEVSPRGGPEPPAVPDYKLLRLIGEGGFGQVWLAANRTTGHVRAVKVILSRGLGAVGQAGREIASIVRLESNLRRQHPNLLDILHVGRTEECLFYVMELADDVSGGRGSLEPSYRPLTLQRRLEGGPLPPEQCVSYARQLLAALGSVHQAGMVHRDVKPANCLFVDGRLKLADFGLLTAASPEVSRAGTLKYMPPDGRMDARADVYAAGLVIYEMITGLPAEDFPRPGDGARQAVDVPVLGVLNRLALRACDPDPGRRFRDGQEMLDELERSASQAAARGPGPHRRLVGTIASLLVLLSLTAWVMLAGWTRSVHVNFVTDPFEATIYLDGRLQVDPDGIPYRTPCTIEDLAAREHHVVFQHAELGTLDAGRLDFSEHRRIARRWTDRP